MTVAVYCTTAISGAHLNPAVTIGMAAIGKFAWASVPGYIVAQVAGALAGVALALLMGVYVMLQAYVFKWMIVVP